MDTLDLRQFESRVLGGGDAAGATFPVRIVSGSRMLISLLVISADPGATVSLDIGNTFEIDHGYESILTMNQTGIGRKKEVLTDFHNLFQFVVTVTGGAATWKLGISLFDNAMTTRIENADIRVDLDAASGDNIAIADRTGTRFLAINADGSLNAKLDDGSPDEHGVYTYGETPSPIAAGISTEIVSYTVPAGRKGWLEKIEGSGENIAEWEVLVNGVRIDFKRTWFSGGLNVGFDFIRYPDRGLELAPGDVVSVSVNHYRPAAGLFNARVQSVEASI